MSYLATPADALSTNISKILLRLRSTYFAILILFIPIAAIGWGPTGHRVVAQIAYDNLTPAVKKKVEELSEFLVKDYPYSHSFLQISYWPDILRGHGITAFNTWHYTGKFYGEPKYSVKTSNAIESHDVVWAIKQSRSVLASRRSNTFEKAFFLRFLVHFVGDIHQPMHCISLYNDKFLSGDAGGTRYRINTPEANNLHKLWDKGVGLFVKHCKRCYFSVDEVKLLAEVIELRYPRAIFEKKIAIKQPNVWAEEGYQLAKDYAYKVSEDGTISDKYREKGQAIVKERIALAGYRLAMILNEVFS